MRKEKKGRWINGLLHSADSLARKPTFKQLDGAGDNGDAVLGNERVLAKGFRLNNAKTQSAFHYHDAARSLLKSPQQ